MYYSTSWPFTVQHRAGKYLDEIGETSIEADNYFCEDKKKFRNLLEIRMSVNDAFAEYLVQKVC